MAPSFCAFQNFARPLRIGCDGDFYYKSFKSPKISTFWSHSWHGGHWKKILTLLTFYNASAALVCGFLIAILMTILFCYRLLPSVDRAAAGDNHRWSNWCLCSGFVMTTLLTFLWRSQKKIFLDRLCISQTDDRLKAQAIFSLAGLLKQSDVMLILWDPTWTETCRTCQDYFLLRVFIFCGFPVSRIFLQNGLAYHFLSVTSMSFKSFSNNTSFSRSAYGVSLSLLHF